MAPLLSIASLFIFLEEDIESIKRWGNPFRFRDYANINGYLSLLRNKMDVLVSKERFLRISNKTKALVISRSRTLAPIFINLMLESTVVKKITDLKVLCVLKKDSRLKVISGWWLFLLWSSLLYIYCYFYIRASLVFM